MRYVIYKFLESVNGTLFGKRFFGDIMKDLEIKSPSISQMCPTSDDRLSYKKQKRRRPCEDGDRDWNDTVTTQEGGGRGKECFSLRALEGTWPY